MCHGIARRSCTWRRADDHSRDGPSGSGQSRAHRLQVFTTAEDEPMVMRATTLMRIMLIVLAAMSAAGCELIGGIFKAGIWVGAIGVILLVVLLVVGVSKLKG